MAGFEPATASESRRAVAEAVRELKVHAAGLELQRKALGVNILGLSRLVGPMV
jgi:hypothetical protein